MKYQGVYSHHDYKSEYSVTDIASPDVPVIIIRQEQEHQSSLPSDRQTVASGSREMREELGIDPYTNPYELSLNN